MGSSPLARGTHCVHFSHGVSFGLIPARAGNTLVFLSLFAACRAHPRSRGEHESYGKMSAREAGSSPLARGTPLADLIAPPAPGLIPARAGNTGRPTTDSPRAWAHPRSRGEHPEFPAGRAACRGSSPLARGTPHRKRSSVLLAGLIPARAGNTRAARAGTGGYKAHPRSRGEHYPSVLLLLRLRGSSPLARGTPNAVDAAKPAPGLIPARAGNTH